MVQGTPKLLGRRKTVGLPAEAPAARFDADVTLAAVAREWLLDLRVMGRSPRTIGFYDQKLKQFLRESAATRLTDLTAFELKRYIGELRDRELSDHTIHGAYEVLKAVGNWAHREGYPVDPALLLVRAPKVANKEMETFTHPQVDTLLEAAPQGWPRLAVQILLGTGMRLGELVALTLDDIEDDGDIAFLKIRHGKGAKFRRTPMSDRLRREVNRYLNRWRPEVSSRSLLVMSTGRPVREITVSELFRRLRAKTGLAVRAHKLRHTFATEYLRNGGDIERLRRLLGHTTYLMVMRYVHLDKGDLARDINTRSPF
jgi:site-specific recombinase XerD